MKENPIDNYDVCVVGGAGRVGLPLALVLADSGFKTLILDINKTTLEKIAAGSLPDSMRWKKRARSRPGSEEICRR